MGDLNEILFPHESTGCMIRPPSWMNNFRHIF